MYHLISKFMTDAELRNGGYWKRFTSIFLTLALSFLAMFHIQWLLSPKTTPYAEVLLLMLAIIIPLTGFAASAIAWLMKFLSVPPEAMPEQDEETESKIRG